MRIDLYALRKARLFKISSPGEWVSLPELVRRYNERYKVPYTATHAPKLVMHERRLERIIKRLVSEGCYEYDPERGYRFLTSKTYKD